ncbi:MAG: superoxide dismutase [Clostridiaceae bacterium]|nr:superoxide dismutase [Clostridiaceae bacterium]
MKKFTLPDLPYAYDALQPVIDKETMMFHHDKHHAAYVNNLNKALEGLDLQFDNIESILENLDQIPEDKRQAVINNGGGHYNHSLFWEAMKPGAPKSPVSEDLREGINADFGGLENFKQEFEAKGVAQFGSGWVWLVYQDDKLKVVSTKNQDSPIMDGAVPLLGNDVWEHAYYLKYQNRRADYLKAWWDVVNWDVVNKRFSHVRDHLPKID